MSPKQRRFRFTVRGFLLILFAIGSIAASGVAVSECSYQYEEQQEGMRAYEKWKASVPPGQPNSLDAYPSEWHIRNRQQQMTELYGQMALGVGMAALFLFLAYLHMRVPRPKQTGRSSS